MPLNKSFGEHNFPGDEKLCYIAQTWLLLHVMDCGEPLQKL